ncbi:hypothetical protein BSLG_001092 [Batrachochytrium salamandrivorans]|nr:hypothetical protein BSLG_001092 [Batrachochytrium salamandrivorans]
MLTTIFTRPAANIRYATQCCSVAALLSLVLVVSLLLLPLVLAYLGGSFWLKENFYWEQPQVQYSQQLLLLLEGVSSSTALPVTVIYSSDTLFNQLTDPYVRMVAVKSWMVDTNADNKNDQMVFNISVPVSDDELVEHVRLAIGVQYQLSERIKFYTQSLLLIDVASPLSGSHLSLDSDLNLVQRWPIQDKVSYISTAPAINFTMAVGNDYSALTWPRIVSDYLDYDARTIYNPVVPIWSTSRSTGQSFTISVKIRIPKDRIAYRPALLEILKHGWIQYLACLVIVAVMLIPGYEFLLRHQVVATHVSLRSAVRQDAVDRTGFKHPLF